MNIEVLSSNFATVDLCEEPCYTEPPEKGKYGGRKTRKKVRKARGDDKAAICKRVSAKPVFAAALLQFFQVLDCSEVD